MSFLERAIARVAPGLAVERARNRAAWKVITARYDAATNSNRGKSWKPVGSDADEAGRQREKLAFVARDMVRNTAYAGRIKQVVANNVVGDGIIPKVNVKGRARSEALRATLEAHFDTTAIDANGVQNLYGLQRLIMATVVEAGEVLVRRRRRFISDGLPLPFQIEVIEADFLCEWKDGSLQNGGEIRNGVEYDAIGRRVAYWLYAEHPGTTARTRMKTEVRRVAASEILHIYRQDRPGQMRGVSWFAPIAMLLQDMADYQDAQVMRQKIAACFAAFVTSPEPDSPAEMAAKVATSLAPGRIERLPPGEEITFSTPPGAEGFGEFAKHIYRATAAGIGITYEALTGDLEGVNFSSGRMGRSEMNRNVSGWQWLLMIPQFLQPLSIWTLEAFEMVDGRLPKGSGLTWVPPYRELIDPTKEITALAAKIKSGLASRQSIIRELGFDPERVMEEIKSDQDAADQLGLVFDTDVRGRPAAGGQPESKPPVTGGADNPPDGKGPGV
jgi:lambda family phage portal protein